jgi:hypothetical protein
VGCAARFERIVQDTGHLPTDYRRRISVAL